MRLKPGVVLFSSCVDVSVRFNLGVFGGDELGGGGGDGLVGGGSGGVVDDGGGGSSSFLLVGGGGWLNISAGISLGVRTLLKNSSSGMKFSSVVK